MQISGPFTPVANTPLVEYDPAVNTPASVAVQVQNSSTFILVVSCGGLQYPIPAFTAATLPINQAQIILDPLYSAGTGAGVIVLGWLQQGEQSPVPDGPLVGVTEILSVATAIKVIEYGGSLGAAVVCTSQGSSQTLLTTTANVLRIQAVQVSNVPVGSGNDPVSLGGNAYLAIRPTFGTEPGVLWSMSWLKGDIPSGYYSLNGQYEVPGGFEEYKATFYEEGNTTDTVLVSMSYDVLS